MAKIKIDNTFIECNRFELSHYGQIYDEVDIFVLLLGKDGHIIEDSDFVFYNSECRGDYDGVKSYDEKKYDSRRVWMNSTMPMTPDSAVFIDRNNEKWTDVEYDELLDIVNLNLDKVKKDIDSIVFSLVVYQSPCFTTPPTFGKNANIRVELECMEDRKMFYSKNLSSDVADDNIFITCKFKRIDDFWEFSIINKGYKGGVQKLIDMFVE